MALDFPNSPVDGQQFTSNNITWVYSSSLTAWRSTDTRVVIGSSLNNQILYNSGNAINGSNGITFNSSSNTIFTNTVNVSGTTNTLNLIVGNADILATLTGANTISTSAFTKANTSVQNNATTLITTGYTYQTFNAGSNVAAFITWTPNAANGNYQYANTNGPFTLAAPASDSSIDIMLTNGASAGAITFSGYTVQSGGTGDTYATTNANRYLLSIRRLFGVSTYLWKALQ